MEQISLEDINLDIIPIKVLQDVDRRIADWKAFGGGVKTLMRTFRIS